MKNPRKILSVTMAALLVAAAILVQSFNLAASRHLDSVQLELRKLLGMDIRFASLEVHLLGWPGFAAKELRIADDPRFAATPILRARELILGVQLWQLLFGRVVIDALTLREPEFQIITDETGLFNLDLLTQRRTESPPAPQIRTAPTEPKASRVSFAVNALRIQDGRVIYLDRSVKQPTDLQLGDVDLIVRGLEGKKTARFRFAAALAEGLGQDVHIDGAFDAAVAEQSWLRREMNLTIRLDSLHVPVVARAVAALRDKIPRELEVTGPMSLEAQAAGTLARPRFENITLKAPVFGSSDYNATIRGDIKFSARRSWEDAELNGTLTVDPLPLGRLRNLNWFRQNLFPALVTDGAVGLYARFEGTWDKLRVGALVRADKSEWKFRNWVRKALDRPAEITARFARQKDKLFFHESELASGPNRIGFLGFVDIGNQPKLQLRIYSRRGLLQEWRELILPEWLAGATGQTDLNIVIDRNLLPEDDSWSMHGYVKLIDGEFKQAQGGGDVESVNGTITFSGRQAKFENVKFRHGGSTFALAGVVANILDPEAHYQLRSTQLDLTNLKLPGGGAAILLNDFSARGAAQIHNGTLVLEG
ncbi:MAG: AsmA family protein, partial [Candidatus Binatia bacterium]